MEQFSNNASSTLNAPISSSQLFLLVVSAAGFPTSGNFRILVDSEIMLVTGVSGTQFSVTRAQEGTTGAAHNTGANVTNILTAGALVQLRLDAEAGSGGGASSGLAAARPSATGSGKLYFCDDLPVVYLDDPTLVAWKQYGIMGYQPAPMAISNWTAVGQLGLYQRGDSILGLATATSNNGAATAGLQAIPGSFISANAWVVTCFGFLATQAGSRYPMFGAAVTNGLVGGTSTMYYMVRYGSSNGWIAGSITLNATGGRSVYNQLGDNDQDFVFFGLNTRLLNDGTNLYFQISADGMFWRNVNTQSLPGGLTDYGFFIGTDGGDGANGLSGALVEKAHISAPITALVSNVTTNGTVFTVTTSTAHGLPNGGSFSIFGLNGTGVNPNGAYLDAGLVVTSTTSFTVPYTSSFTYTSGGTVTNLSF